MSRAMASGGDCGRTSRPLRETGPAGYHRLMSLNLIKLCVGCDTVEELMSWRREQAAQSRSGHARIEQAGIEQSRIDKAWRLRTRQTPKRAAELTESGSLYRVFKGLILCRQAILAVETVGEGKAAHCEILLAPEIVRVTPTPRRPFQGWRYLPVEDAPADLSPDGDMGSAPPALAARLREIGVW